jgi:hypothetical protein
LYWALLAIGPALRLGHHNIPRSKEPELDDLYFVTAGKQRLRMHVFIKLKEKFPST